MASRSQLASDREREAALDRLSGASAAGRLSFDELDERAAQVGRARTRSELERLVADVPEAAGAYAAAAPRERAVLSSLKRGGRWRPAPQSRYTALLGSVEVDLRRAVLPEEGLDIELRSVLGSARVKVPPGVDVEVVGGGVLVSRDIRVDGDPAPPGAPVVRVRTRGLLGSTQVRTQAPLLDRLVGGARRLAERGRA